MKVPAAVVLEAIALRIVQIRGQKVMIDADLAELYGVQTKVLVQAVKRNLERFPKDFMFQLANQDVADLRSQSVTSSLQHGGRRTMPYAFTEQGVAMLSSVLNSPRAVAVNIGVKGAVADIFLLTLSRNNFTQRLYQYRALRIRADSNTQELIDARQFEVAHDDAAFAQLGGKCRCVVLRMAREYEIGA